MKAPIFASFAVLGLMLFACSSESGEPGSDSSSSNVVARPLPEARAVCGDVICGEGLECCNSSCGICVPPGNDCTQQACAPADPPETDAGPAGEACGEVTCGPGLECCNSSCGICVPPGGACIQLECARL